MQLIRKFNIRIRFLLCVIDIFSKHSGVIITITNAFENFLNKSDHKPSNIWVDKSSEFYNRSIKLFSQNNDIEMKTKICYCRKID